MKLVVVTGASSGIGAATARLFSKNGFAVALLARRKEQLEQVAKSCEGATYVIPCDLSNSISIATAASEVKKLKEPLTHLINNAGIYQSHSFVEGGTQPWTSQFQTNLLGPVQLTQLLIPSMSEGSIINVSSGLGANPAANVSAYCASKAAMNMWTQCMALELAPKIRVNTVAPGLVDTPIHRDTPKENWDEWQPMKRVGRPEEIADAIYFLAEKSPWTTGAILTVDGGINLT